MTPTLDLPDDLVGHDVLHDEIVAERMPWAHVVPAGHALRIIDLEGNQAVDTILYNANDHAERYSSCETIARQRNIFLERGTELVSSRGRTMMTITADTCGRHDTSGGACSRESNTLRYGHHTRHLHACVDNFLLALSWHGMGKRDMVSNINFFMNVPVEADGSLGIVDGLSAPGKYLDLTAAAEMDVLVAVSNCPQVCNPCNGFNPTPVRMIVYVP